MSRRARASGRSIRMCRSNLPARITAGSRCSRELVAAITSNPRSPWCASSDVSSWLTARRDSWSGVLSRRCATESNSSKKSRQGRFCSAVSNALSMMRAEPPTMPESRSPRRHVHEVEVVLARDCAREERLADAGRAVEENAVPVDPVSLRLLRVPEHQADRVAHLALERVHAADVGERRQLLGRLHLELAAAVAAP